MSEVPDYVEKVVTFLTEKKGRDISVLDLREASDSIDYFVVCTGTGAPHLKAMQGGLERVFKNAGLRPYRKAGSADSGWMVLDVNNMMVHLFTEEMREYYDLENLWSEASALEWE